MRKREKRVLFAILAAAVGALLAARLPEPEPAAAPEDLPELGTQLGQFPAGPMKVVADQACLNCHSAEMALQQRLTDKQWATAVTKMMGWGAPVPEDQKDALVAYLAEHFGTDNDRFVPTAAAPVKP